MLISSPPPLLKTHRCIMSNREKPTLPLLKYLQLAKKAVLPQNRHRACKKYGKRTHFFHHISPPAPSQMMRMVQNLPLRAQNARCFHRPSIPRHYEQPRPLGWGDVLISQRFQVTGRDTNPLVVHNQAGLRRFVCRWRTRSQ